MKGCIFSDGAQINQIIDRLIQAKQGGLQSGLHSKLALGQKKKLVLYKKGKLYVTLYFRYSFEVKILKCKTIADVYKCLQHV